MTKVAPNALVSPTEVRTLRQDLKKVKGTMSEAELKALYVISGTQSTVTTTKYIGSDSLQVGDVIAAAEMTGDQVVAGNLSTVERILTGQLVAMDAIFNNLAQRAIRQSDIKTMETLLRLAMKAQAQTRTTAETLSALKNPTAVFAQQANIAHGPQQVNNGLLQPSPTPAAPKFRKTAKQTIEAKKV